MKDIYRIFLSIVLGCLLVACTNEIGDDAMMRDGRYVYVLNLQGGVTGYGETTRATKVWKTGDVIYLRFSTSATAVGTATYKDGVWTLVVDKELQGSGTCQAVMFDNAVRVIGDVVEMGAETAVYQDDAGQWSRTGNTLLVTAHLSPVLGRLRLKGANGTAFSLEGLTTYTSYNCRTGQFTTTQNAVSGVIGSAGYSNYFHGLLANVTSPTIRLNDYTMACPSTMMTPGQSGWLNYPTESNHVGWMVDTPGTPETPVDVHEYVDLGLSVKWATCNVGASSPEEYGDYYAWGETETKSQYVLNTYKWMAVEGSANWRHINKYQILDEQTEGIWYKNGVFVGDNKTVLDIDDDVAHVKWGGQWRMPTADEQDELCNKCDWTWTTENGIKGYKVISKSNGNSIFLPAAGGYQNEGKLTEVGVYGLYWSDVLATNYTDYAYHLYFNSGRVWRYHYAFRHYGFPVRPVCP